MKINYNVSAVIATNSLNKNDNKLQQTMARLSSGLKIVNAKDNPAGLAMSKRMKAQLEGIDQATQNSGDGVSIIEIADGTLAEIHDMLQRINELAVKSSTGTIQDDDREMVDQEVQQLKKEITRIANESEFNGQKLLDGSFELKGYTDSEDVKVSYYSESVVSGIYNINLSGVVFKDDGTIDEEAVLPTVTDNNTNEPKLNGAEVTKVDGNIVTITGELGFEIKLRVTKSDGQSPDADGSFSFGGTNGINLNLTGFGAMDMQIGANEGQQLGIIIPKVSLENMGIASISMKTQEDSEYALSKMSDAIHFVSSVRSGLGAYQNRLEHTINYLDVANEGMTAAYSRIMDADMAEEMTNYTTLQVITQASTSMLAQANERPSQVLQLLQ